MRLAIIIISSLLIVSSCKYKEGPGLSFRSKKERVANSWYFDQVVEEDGTDMTEEFKSWALSFNVSGRLEVRYSIIGLPFDDVGSWQFQDKKKNIELTYSNTVIESFIEKEYRIIKLKERDFVIESLENKTRIFLKPI